MARKPDMTMIPKPKSKELFVTQSTHELIVEVHEKIAKLEGVFGVSKWVFASVVTAGVAWLSWVTQLLVSKL